MRAHAQPGSNDELRVTHVADHSCDVALPSRLGESRDVAPLPNALERRSTCHGPRFSRRGACPCPLRSPATLSQPPAPRRRHAGHPAARSCSPRSSCGAR